jgi:hypothetical protein
MAEKIAAREEAKREAKKRTATEEDTNNQLKSINYAIATPPSPLLHR